MTNSEKFESEIFTGWRNAFYKELEEIDNSTLSSILDPLIASLNYKEVINKIKSLQEFPLLSKSIENIKLDWWHNYLADNMKKTKNNQITITDFDGSINRYTSIEEVYEKFIAIKNQTIWIPYHNVFTKIFVEWVVGGIISTCKNVPVDTRLEFINKSISLIDKDQAFEEYTKLKLNEHLNYYRLILQATLTEVINENQFYNNNKVFSAFTENDRIVIIRNSLIENNFPDFFRGIKTIYSSIPYQLFSTDESYFHSIFHIILVLLSDSTISEEATNHGRIDTSILINNCVFIFEFKLENSRLAIEQIHKRKYYEKYQAANKKIFLIGVSFDKKQKNIKDWIIDKV